MKIGIITDVIDAYGVGNGIGEYSYNIVKNLKRLDNENEYHLIHRYTNDLDIYEPYNDVVIPPLRIPYKTYTWRLVTLPRKLKRMGLDLIHDVIDISPLYFDMPCKKVVTIHDLSVHLFPQMHSRELVLAHKLLDQRVKYVDRVITVSDNSKRDIEKYMKVPPDKIKVIYAAVGADFRQFENKEIVEFRHRYNIEYPFILSISVLEPRKNLPFLIKAFHKLKRSGIEHKLVIGGRRGWKYQEIFKTVESLGLQDDVVFTGYIPTEDLPKFYNAADLFVYPSLYEGFGTPPLEAMACGTPVITSNTSSLPEVVGDAGIMVNPYDVDELADAMLKVLKHKSLRQDMVKRGLERAKMFSWEKTAREILKVYGSLNI